VAVVLSRILTFVLVVILIAGCGGPLVDDGVKRSTVAPTAAPEQAGAPAAAPADAADATTIPPAATQPPRATPGSEPTAVPPAATPAPAPPRGTWGLAVGNGVQPAAVAAVLAALNGAGMPAESVLDKADLVLSTESGAGARLAWERVLVPVDRMSSVLTGITLKELRDVWTGAGTSANFATIYPDEAIVPALDALLGAHGPAVKPQPVAALADAVWGDKMGLGIVPFEDLSLRLRAIPVEGNSPADNRFRAADWPLAARAWLAPATERGGEALAAVAGALPDTNRDPKKLTTLIMTGVTAMARNSAAAIEKSGDYGFLARQIGPELAAADITVISNEIPFVEGCKVNTTRNNIILCSKPEYFENLALTGVDAVGLTGNHMNDFGHENDLASLAFYAEKGIPVYAAGANEEAARRPAILEHNGNRLAFLGANQWGPESYVNGLGQVVSEWAGADTPGSARFDRDRISADIRAVKPEVDLVFAEVQHTESNAAGDYVTEPIPLQEGDFGAMSDAGADVVTGVQAHAPQAVELRDGRLILYGLGNLFFDQTFSWPTRTGLVPRHTIYDGRLINTELLVTVIQDDKQLRWATPEERMQVLRTVFDASRW
jgi:poly-gamma-glutamate synthesis protein (capsule biosynthesis protein)